MSLFLVRAVLLTLSLLLLPFLADSGSSHPETMDSVRPLSMELYDHETGTLQVRPICTVSSINAALHLWMTAGHCILEMPAEGVWVERRGLSIANHHVFVVKADPQLDLALLFTPDFSLPGLRLASRMPTWEDPVRVFGYAWGYPDLSITEGRIANPLALLDGTVPYLLFSAQVAPGHSGSPVVNKHGEMVSVVQIGWGRGYSPGGGAPLDVVRMFAGSYFG